MDEKSNRKEINFFNIIYDDDFISLLNGLSSSIKEYYNLTKLNINSTTNYTNNIENQDLLIKNILKEITNLSKSNEINLQLEKLKESKIYIEKINKDNEKNLINFLENAKNFFKKMKQTRNEKLSKINIGLKNYKSTRDLNPKSLSIKQNNESVRNKSVSHSSRIKNNQDQIVKLANNVIYFITKLNEKKNNDDEQINYMKKELNLLAKNAIIRHSSSSPRLNTNIKVFDEKNMVKKDKDYINKKLKNELKNCNIKINELNNIIEELKKKLKEVINENKKINYENSNRNNYTLHTYNDTIQKYQFEISKLSNELIIKRNIEEINKNLNFEI